MNNPDSKKSNSLIKDIFIFGLGTLGSKLIMFLLVPLYTNILTPSEYGVSELVMTAAELLIPFVSVVIFEAVLRYGLDTQYSRKDVLFSSFVVCLIGSLLTILITPLFSFYSSISPWKWYMCTYVIIYLFHSTEMMYLKVCKKNKMYAILSCVQTFILATTNILLLTKLDMGIKGYLLSIIISHLVVVFFIFMFGGVRIELWKSKLSKKLSIEMLRYSFPLIFNNISWWVIHSSDKFMIENMINSSSLGVYTVALKLSAIINLFVSVFSQAWSVSSIQKYDSKRENNYFFKVFEGYSFVCFFGAILLISISKWFMRIYVGADFFESAIYVPLMIVGTVFSALTAFYSRLFSVVKKNKVVMATTVIAAIANVIVNYILISVIGIWGAIIGTICAYIIMLHLQMFFIRKYMCVKIHVVNYVISCILLLVISIATTLNYYVLPISFSCIGCLLFIKRKLIYGVLHNARQVFFKTKGG